VKEAVPALEKLHRSLLELRLRPFPLLVRPSSALLVRPSSAFLELLLHSESEMLSLWGMRLRELP
jgi:hypothetical protein